MSDTELAFRTTLDGSGFANGAQQITGHLNHLGIQTQSASANLGGLGTILGTMANPATAAALAVTAVGGAIASSVSVAGDFQQKMAGVNAIVGGSAADMQTLSSAAREAGASTSFSASQAADALGFMAGAGWNVTQSTAALKDTLTLASAGGMDLAQAGDLMTNTVSQFGLAATDAGRVSNVLAAGAAATNTSVSQLGAGMTVVGSTASAFGMSLESTTSALGQLSNAGIKGAEGGTALRGILASLATQSGPAAAVLQEMGVSAADLDPTTHSLAESMGLLNEKGMTASQAIQIFGRENVSAATYMAAHASSLDGLQTSITGTSKASEMAAIQTNTYQGAMGELSSATEEAEIALGTALLPTVTSGVQILTDLVQIGTAAGGALADFGGEVMTAMEPVADAFMNYTPMGLALGAASDVASEAWTGLKEWATGSGEEIADATAEGVKASEELKTATGENLKSDEAKKEIEEAAAESVDSFGDEYLKKMKESKISEELYGLISAGFSDAAALAAYNSQSGGENDTFLRQFDYMGEQIRLSLSKGGNGWFDSLKVGDVQMGSTATGSSWQYDPVAAFETLTGMPAPTEGTAAYYYLLGDEISAKRAELQEKLKPEGEATALDFDPTKWLDDIMEREAMRTILTRIISDASGEASTEAAKESAQKYGEALQSVDWANLPGIIAAGEAMKSVYGSWYSGVGDMSYADLIDEQIESYKDALVAGITDIRGFAATKAEEMMGDITQVFEDDYISEDERTNLLGLGPILDLIKEKSPDAFSEAGLDSIQRFIEMVESGASAEELAAYFADLGDEAGKGFAEALGMNMQDALEKFDWKRLLDPALMSELGAGWKDFAENAFTAGELVKNASDNLDLWNTGLPENRDQVRQNIEIYKDLYEANKWLYTDEDQAAIEAYMQAQIDEETLLEILADKTQELTKETKKFTDQTTDACTECGKLMSAFGAWQEETPELFRADYVGISYGSAGEAYVAGKWADNILRDVQAGAIAMGSEQYEAAIDVKTTLHDPNGNAYTDEEISRGLLRTLIGADPDNAERYNVDLNIGLNTPTPTKAATATSQAEAQGDTSTRQLYDISATLRAMQSRMSTSALQTSTTNSITARMGTSTSALQASMTASSNTISGAIGTAANSIISVLYELLGPGGGAGGGAGGDAGWSTTSSWISPVSGFNPDLYYYSEGGYASSPRLAVVGDSPGGEYMVPAQQLESFIRAMSPQLQADSIGDVAIPPITVPVVLDIDSVAMRATVERVLYEIFADVRVP